MNAAVRRFGVFGGSFDPPHAAHLALACLARDALALDTLFVVPAGQPWQKAGRPMSPAEDRAAMTALLLQGQPRLVLERCELQRAGPSYTVDTLRELQAREAPHGPAAWFLVIGQDQYAKLPTWHRWPELLALATLAVAGREGDEPAPPPELAAVPHRVVHLALPPLPLSSTGLRTRLARGERVDTLVPPQVAGYIDQHRLYKN